MIWELRGTVAIFILCSFGTHGTGAQVAVTDQPDNVTVCLGGTAVFTCVMDISNVTINKGDVKWWRIRTDQSSGILPLSESTARYKVTNTINNQRLNSTLIIANVISTLSGPYWPGRTENSHLCEMAFLSINDPTALTVNVTKSVASSSIVVQWDAVDDSLITTYVVTWTKNGVNLQTATLTERTSYTITGLTLDTVYTITVTARNDCDRGPEFTTSVLFSANTVSTILNISPTTITTISATTTAISVTTTATSTASITNTTTITSTITTTAITTNATTTTVDTTSNITSTNASIIAATLSIATSITSSAAYSRSIKTDPTAIDSGNSDGSSGGAIAGGVIGGVIGGIILIIVIIIIIIVICFYICCKNKDNDDGKSAYYSVIASNGSSNGKTALTVSSNEMYSEVQKLQAKTVPHRTTETGEIYAMSTKGVSEEAHSELYTYARVDQKKIVEMSVPHKAAADGVQYAVSTKVAAAKEKRATDDDKSINIEDKTIDYADLELLSSPAGTCDVHNESPSQYAQLAI